MRLWERRRGRKWWLKVQVTAASHEAITEYSTRIFEADAKVGTAIVQVCRGNAFSDAVHAMILGDLYGEGCTQSNLQYTLSDAVERIRAGRSPWELVRFVNVRFRFEPTCVWEEYPYMQESYVYCGERPGEGVLLMHLTTGVRPWSNVNNRMVCLATHPALTEAVTLAAKALAAFNKIAAGAAIEAVRYIVTRQVKDTHTGAYEVEGIRHTSYRTEEAVQALMRDEGVDDCTMVEFDEDDD